MQPTLTCHCLGHHFKIPSIKISQNLKQYFGGDIQKFASKLPGFIWEKYKGEHHLPSYNYLGPNTRLDIRLARGRQELSINCSNTAPTAVSDASVVNAVGALATGKTNKTESANSFYKLQTPW